MRCLPAGFRSVEIGCCVFWTDYLVRRCRSDGRIAGTALKVFRCQGEMDGLDGQRLEAKSLGGRRCLKEGASEEECPAGWCGDDDGEGKDAPGLIEVQCVVLLSGPPASSRKGHNMWGRARPSNPNPSNSLEGRRMKGVWRHPPAAAAAAATTSVNRPPSRERLRFVSRRCCGNAAGLVLRFLSSGSVDVGRKHDKCNCDTLLSLKPR
ncbi:hypothetical protein VTK26DRAFT_8972 [Humicola hyalothermophila]